MKTEYTSLSEELTNQTKAHLKQDDCIESHRERRSAITNVKKIFKKI